MFRYFIFYYPQTYFNITSVNIVKLLKLFLVENDVNHHVTTAPKMFHGQQNHLIKIYIHNNKRSNQIVFLLSDLKLYDVTYTIISPVYQSLTYKNANHWPQEIELITNLASPSAFKTILAHIGL